jgi:hypothetical protein
MKYKQNNHTFRHAPRMPFYTYVSRPLLGMKWGGEWIPTTVPVPGSEEVSLTTAGALEVTAEGIIMGVRVAGDQLEDTITVPMSGGEEVRARPSGDQDVSGYPTTEGQEYNSVMGTITPKKVRVPHGRIPNPRSQQVFVTQQKKEVLCPRLAVKKSTVPDAGRGLFAEQDIPKGAVITEYNGVVTDLKSAQLLVKKDLHMWLKCFQAKFPFVLDGRPREKEEGGLTLAEMCAMHEAGSLVNESRSSHQRHNAR